MITIIAPEVVIGLAFDARMTANATLRNLSALALEDGVPWTLTHSYFANMGGFVMRSKSSEAIEMLPKASLEDRRLLRVSDSADRGPEIEANGSETNTDLWDVVADSAQHIPYSNPYHLSGGDIIQLRKDGILPKLPNISQAELEDRSKSDSFVKSITLAQITWATLQLVVRSGRKLAISQLELAVLAFAACAVVIYTVYWPKPKDVSATTTILEFEGSIPNSVLNSFRKRNAYVGRLITEKRRTSLRPGDPIDNDTLDDAPDNKGVNAFLLAVMLGTIGFGCIHIGAWNFEFPTKIEVVIWQCASLYTALCSVLMFLLILLFTTLNIADTFLAQVLSFRVPFFFYIIARLALLVEIFRTLFFLPPDAYVSTWTQFIPHFG